MAALIDVQNAYFAANRKPLDAATATTVLAAIERGQTTLAAYTADLIQKSSSTTGAAVAMLSVVTGFTPSSRHLDDLKVAADAQLAQYRKVGVSNADLGPFEAFGKGLAADASTGFAAKYGALSAADFITAAYWEIYGQGPSSGAFANLSAQIAYFAELYVKAGTPAADAALQAKGAVLGQVVGYAFTNPAAAALATIDDRVGLFLEKAASGTATYGAVLPSPTPPVVAPVFGVSKDGSNAVAFANPGTTISVTQSGGTYTFVSSGTVSGTATVGGTISSIAVPAGLELMIAGALASGIAFTGTGTVALTDTGSLTAAELVDLEAHVSGLLDASSVTSIASAGVADAISLLVTHQGTSGDRIKTLRTWPSP